jgi:hypothetical protein
LKEQTRIVENIHEGLYEPFLEIFFQGPMGTIIFES